MDQYFKDSHWLVPLSSASKVGAHDRERQLAEGESCPTLGCSIAWLTRVMTEGDIGTAKKETGHDEYGVGAGPMRV